MSIPVKSWFTVFNAISATTTARIPTDGSEYPEYANSVILEVVAATAPSWTLDIQGKTHPSGTFVAVDYVPIWVAGLASFANSQLSITDTTRRFYLIPNCPPFLQLIGTRTAGTLTIRGAYTSEVFTQWLPTSAVALVVGQTAASFTLGDAKANATNFAQSSAQDLLYYPSLTYGFNGTSWDRLRVATAGPTGILRTSSEYSFANMTTNTTTTIKSSAGIFHSLTINTVNATGTITIYDNTAGSGTLIGKVTMVAGDAVTLIYDVKFATGLTLVTATAAGDLTIAYV